MGNSNAVPSREGENIADYLRRKFKTNSRKIDNLVAQELREEEAEELNAEEPCGQESIRRVEALDPAIDQLEPCQPSRLQTPVTTTAGQLLPCQPARLQAPFDSTTRPLQPYQPARLQTPVSTNAGQLLPYQPARLQAPFDSTTGPLQSYQPARLQAPFDSTTGPLQPYQPAGLQSQVNNNAGQLQPFQPLLLPGQVPGPEDEWPGRADSGPGRAGTDESGAPGGGPNGQYRARLLVQEATPQGSRTYCEDVEVGEEFVAQRRVYEETYVTRRVPGERPTVIAQDWTQNDSQQQNATNKDLVPEGRGQERQQHRSRFSRLRHMTMNLFRRRRAEHQPPPAIENTASSGGDFIDQPRVSIIDMDDESESGTKAKKDEVATSRPGTRISSASRQSMRDEARPVSDGGATMIAESCRTPLTGRAPSIIRKKSGDAAIQKGPDRGIVWPKKMEELYSQTDKAYYIEQFQRTELFRHRSAKRDQGSTNWKGGLTPFQIWVIDHVGTAEMVAILTPKSKVRPNNALAKVECWRADKKKDKARPKRTSKKT